jgi:drug/metabolite transporter (DMT)-like permease
LHSFSAIEITSLAFSIVLLPAIFINYAAGTWNTIQTNSHAYEGLGYISILAIVGTALAVIVFNQIIRYSSALFASSVTYMIPVVAVIIGLFFGESISWTQVGAMALVLSGVFIANYWQVLFVSSK